MGRQMIGDIDNDRRMMDTSPTTLIMSDINRITIQLKGSDDQPNLKIIIIM